MSARLLIQTKNQQRIEEMVRIEWQTGSCNVWVSEIGRCECANRTMTIQNRSLINEVSKTTVIIDGKEADNEKESLGLHNDDDRRGLLHTDDGIQRREGDLQKDRVVDGSDSLIGEYEQEQFEGPGVDVSNSTQKHEAY